MTGAKIDLRKVLRTEDTVRNDTILFSESNGRILVSVAHANAEDFMKIMAGTDTAEIGEVTSGGFVKVLGLDGVNVVNLSIHDLKKSWKSLMSKMN